MAALGGQRNVQSVGRLDLPSEGLMLLTDSSELARHCEHPSTGLMRSYAAQVASPSGEAAQVPSHMMGELAAGARVQLLMRPCATLFPLVLGAIRAALVLALAVGVLQTCFFAVCAPSMISGMGAKVGSPMRPVALSYLRVRALGMPTATMWLVSNGIFRGLGDTRTPLIWALLFSALNALLDPLFIFCLLYTSPSPRDGLLSRMPSSA